MGLVASTATGWAAGGKRYLQALPKVALVAQMPTPAQSYASSPARVRSRGDAQAAAAQAVLEKPRVDALFPQLEQEKPQAPAPSPPRALSRASRSEPLMPSPFGRADKANASELSVATTAFIPRSQLGGGSRGGMQAPDALTAALADAAVAGSPAPAPKTQNMFQASLPYRTEAESSVVSDWKLHYWHDGGKGIALQRGLRFQDLRYATNNTPGVCVLKQQDDAPNVPGLQGDASTYGPVREKQMLINAVTKQLLQMGVVLHDHDHGHGHHHGHHNHEKSKKSEGKMDAENMRTAPTQSPDLGRKAGSEASLASHHERKKHLPAVVARARYQKYVVAKPKRGHTFCEPEGNNNPPQ